ncbi:hypothetical protein [Burkholderia territorii]|nr:hypothetical protein [Burkholderia territorii]
MTLKRLQGVQSPVDAGATLCTKPLCVIQHFPGSIVFFLIEGSVKAG